MSLEFEFNQFENANKFGKNLSRNLKATSSYQRRDGKHIIVIPEKNLTQRLWTKVHRLASERLKVVLA